jgi:hypothetical protein
MAFDSKGNHGWSPRTATSSRRRRRMEVRLHTKDGAGLQARSCEGLHASSILDAPIDTMQ